MNKHDNVYFFERKSTSRHEAYIRNSSSIDDFDFTDLVDNVFSHQIAVFEEMNYDIRFDIKSLSKEFVASYFYENCYIPIEINIDIDGVVVNAIKFCERVVLQKTDGVRNKIFFLLGPVGSGKTAFINSLITKYGREWVGNNNVWFVRLDVDIFGDNRLCSVEEMLDGIISKIVRVVAKNRFLIGFKNEDKVIVLFKDLQKKETDFDAKQLILQEFICEFQRSVNRRLFLVVDNLDYLYHMNDRVIFDVDGDKEESRALHSICDLVSIFFHSYLGKLAANILFVLRSDSYEILKESQKLFLTVAAFDSNKNVYSIKPPEWDKVVMQRGRLLEFLISRVKKDGKKVVLTEISRPILDDLKFAPSGQKPLIDHLKNITNFGLRDMMVFFSQYSWLEGQSYKEGKKSSGIERFIHQYPVGLLAFMLKGRRRFNQFKSEFPNIYLVNIKDDFDNRVSSIYQTPHTYWLKRLILHFIKQKQGEGEVVTTSNILNTFAVDDNYGINKSAGTNAYNELLVRKCLGSLAQAKVSNMISVKRKVSVELDKLDVEDIFLTPRGEHCLDHIFDRFFYLQLIVEDYMMPIPRLLASYFTYPEEDYGYIMEPVSEYGPKAKRMIEKKSLQVLFLLEILEISYECEVVKYSSVFKCLHDQGIRLPDISAIRNGVRKEISALVASQGGFMLLENIIKVVDDMRNELTEFFYEAYAD